VTRSRFLLVFGLVLVLRVAIAARFHGNYDTQSFLIVVRAVVSGQNMYEVTHRYNYSPVWAYVATGAWRASGSNVGVFVLLLGLIEIAADAGSTALVSRIGRVRLGLSGDEARRRALLFFSNPVSVLVSCAHGQFDGLSILFLLAALAASARPPTAARRAATSALLAASLLVKHVTLFHVPLFSRRRDPSDPRGLPDALVLAPYAVFAASFLPFLSALPTIVETVVLYGGRYYASRPGALASLFEPEPPSLVLSALLLCGVAWVWLETRRWELTRASLLLFLALICLSPSWGVQYLVWPVALGALYPSAAYGVFTLFAGLYHSAAPESLALAWPIRPRPVGIWVAAAVWLVAETIRGRREEGIPRASAG
jgi:hypothetical protein